MIFRNAEGMRVQENTHTKSLTAARVMLAQRALQRVAALAAQLEDIINEGQAALTDCSVCGRAAGDDWRTADDRHQEIICADCAAAGRSGNKARRGKASDRTRMEVGR